MAESEDTSFIYKHPAVAAVAITLVIGGVFLGLLFSNAGHHEGGGDHASAEHPALGGSGAAHAASGAPTAHATGAAPASH